MRIDMSPEAVSGRLRAMGDLWLLSVKLMNAKSVRSDSQPRPQLRALAIQDSIRQVFVREWNPIGIDGDRNFDEYDAYIGPIYRILVTTRSADELIDRLRGIECEEMGVGPTEARVLHFVAERLLELKVTLD